MTLPDRITGDGPCADCGTTENIVWFTESAFWNHVVRNDDPDAMDAILCIPCFVTRVDAKGLRPTGWRLILDWHWETKVERVRRLYSART